MTMDGRDRPALGYAALHEVLCILGERAWREGRCVEISIDGRGALLLCFRSGRMTEDVDAVFDQDKQWTRQVMAELARERGWPPDWLNDGVKGYLSERDAESKELRGVYPSVERPGLRVLTPKLEYLFAMKALAMRGADPAHPGSGGDRDMEALRELTDRLGLGTAEEALDLVASFYPHARIPPRTEFGLRELFDRLGAPAKPGAVGPCR